MFEGHLGMADEPGSIPAFPLWLHGAYHVVCAAACGSICRPATCRPCSRWSVARVRRKVASRQGNGRPNNRNKRNRGRDNRGPREGGQPRACNRRRHRSRHAVTMTTATTSTSRRYPTRCSRPSIAARIREARQPRREISEDGPIPNPLEQTYDKRGVQKPRGLGGGGGGGGRKGGKAGGSGERQPDPMQTSVGYIGADAFHKQMSGGGGGGRGRGRRRR